MILSKLEIVNTSLALIGIKPTTLTGSSAEVRQYNALFNMSYIGMLGLPIDWRFASARAELAELGEPAFGHFEYQYALPTKCVRVIAQVDEGDDDEEYDYKREVYVDSKQKEHKVILTSTSDCFIRYIRDVNLAQWSYWFCRVVALDLAILMCEPLKQDKQKKNQLLLMMIEPGVGWMDRAIQANNIEDAEVNADGVNLDKGNKDVLNAVVDSEAVRRTYIHQRE